MAYKQELEALQRWVWATANLRSMRLQEAPPKIARPMILWESPDRGKDRDISRWRYVVKVTQYGRLFAKDLDQLLDLQDVLQGALEEQVEAGGLPIYEKPGPGAVIGKLQKLDIKFSNTEGLDVPIQISYEVTYDRKRTVYPAPTFVGTRSKIIEP